MKIMQRLHTWLERPEMFYLALLAVPAALIWGFATLAGEMLEGETLPFDRAILLALRNPADAADPLGPPWLETMVTDFTSLGSFSVLTFITVAAMLYLLVAGKVRQALLVGVAIGGGALLSTGLKMFFDRPRPDFVAHVVETVTASFPSGHAMLSAVTYLTLGVLLARVESRKRLRTLIVGLAVFCTLAVGASRVYLGVHYPSDVLAGWVLGAAWAMLCWLVAWGVEQRRSAA